MNLLTIGDEPTTLAVAVAAKQLGYAITVIHDDRPALEPGLAVLAYRGALGQGEVSIEYRSDIASAIVDDSIVVVGGELRSRAHTARKLAPLVSPQNVILLSPGGFGGALTFARTLRDEGGAQPAIAEVPGYPFTASLDSLSSLTIKAVKRNLPLGVFPTDRTSEVHTVFSTFLDSLVPAASVLETSLKNTNNIVHPPVALLNAARIARRETFTFYREGLVPAAGNLIEAIDAERVQLAQVLGVHSASISELMWQFYSDQGMSRSPIFEQLQEFQPFDNSLGPTSLSHRYIMDDIPFGLAPLVKLGDKLHVSMPVMSSLVEVWSAICERDLWTVGVTIEAMGLDALDLEGIKSYVVRGDV